MINQDNLATLRETAKEILEVRKSNSTPRDPIVIEFSGSPKSGKSTTIDIVGHFFKRSGFRVWAPTEGASKRTPYQLKRDLVAFNSWSLNYAISEILLAFHNVEPHDLVILDRGPFDSLAWMGVLKDQSKISENEYNVIRNYALMDKWAKVVSQIFLFTCTPEISLQRENASKLITGPGTAMNKDMLLALLGQYNLLEGELQDYPVKKIETSQSESPLPTSFQVAEVILNLMNQSE